MTDERIERRLAAILAADVVGYSRLMGQNEERTLADLKSARRSLVDPAIAAHRGRIVKTTGDGLLVEFASAVDAVRCAVEVQASMARRNGDLPQEIRLDYRLGIHVGDIIIDDNDIFGDGVNIAARLEGIAAPGAICISDDTHRQVRGKVDAAFHDMGPQALKNITEPLRVWQIRVDGVAQVAVASSAPALPDKPSIAVLPFQNMSGDAEQDYFADGMVEDIITALSRFKSLFVIARNSSFAYKGKAIDIRNVGRELGVRYVLEGSVRKAGNRVRITAQLIEAASNRHLWADKFDGGLEDVFDLQDKVTSAVVGLIAPRLEMAEIERARQKPTEKLDSYDHYLRGMAALHGRQWPEAYALFKRAIERDPDYAAAHAMLAWSLLLQQAMRGSPLSEESKDEAIRHARVASRLADEDAFALARAGHVLTYLGHEYDLGASMVQQAVDLESKPCDGVVFARMGHAALCRRGIVRRKLRPDAPAQSARSTESRRMVRQVMGAVPARTIRGRARGGAEGRPARRRCAFTERVGRQCRAWRTYSGSARGGCANSSVQSRFRLSPGTRGFSRPPCRRSVSGSSPRFVKAGLPD